MYVKACDKYRREKKTKWHVVTEPSMPNQPWPFVVDADTNEDEEVDVEKLILHLLDTLLAEQHRVDKKDAALEAFAELIRRKERESSRIVERLNNIQMM